MVLENDNRPDCIAWTYWKIFYMADVYSRGLVKRRSWNSCAVDINSYYYGRIKSYGFGNFSEKAAVRKFGCSVNKNADKRYCRITSNRNKTAKHVGARH